MDTNDKTNIENNESKMFQPYLLHAKKIVLGTPTPSLYTKIVFYIGIIISFIFELWNLVSYFILTSPSYLKQNKGIDVIAIIEFRGRNLGFEEDKLYDALKLFHFSAIIVWLCIIIGLVLLWRQIKWASYVIVGGILIFYSCMFFFLGITYFKEDTTLFDKLSVSLLLLMVIINHLITINKTSELISD